MLNPEDLGGLARALEGTRDEELGCDECFERLDRFVEAELAGLDAASAMPVVYHHLQMCGECREEYEALYHALRAGSGSASRIWARLRRFLRPS